MHHAVGGSPSGACSASAWSHVQKHISWQCPTFVSHACEEAWLKKVILSLIFSFINYFSCSQPNLTSTPRCSPHECAYSEERSLFFQVKNILTANIGAFITWVCTVHFRWEVAGLVALFTRPTFGRRTGKVFYISQSTLFSLMNVIKLLLSIVTRSNAHHNQNSCNEMVCIMLSELWD